MWAANRFSDNQAGARRVACWSDERIPQLSSTRALLAHGGFRRFWLASGISAAGDGVSYVAIPLTAAVALEASILEMSALSAVMWLPGLMFATHVGHFADKARRTRSLMIASDLARAALLASIGVGYMVDALSMPQLLVAVFLIGIFSTVHGVQENTLFVSLTPEKDYVKAQSLLQGGSSTASIAGSTLGGVLVSIFSGPIALLVDVVSYLASAALLGRVRETAPQRRSGSPDNDRVSTGLKFIAGDPHVRGLLLVTATSGFFEVMFSSMVVVYLARQLNMGPVVIGAAVAVAAGGAVLGSAMASRLVDRFGVYRTLLFATLLASLPLLATPVAGFAGAVLAASAIVGFGSVLQDITIGTIFSSLVQDELRSRVRGAFMAISFGVRPIGALLAGVLASQLGLRTTLILAASGGAAAALWLVFSPVWRASFRSTGLIRDESTS
jgi:MFS family permease